MFSLQVGDIPVHAYPEGRPGPPVQPRQRQPRDLLRILEHSRCSALRLLPTALDSAVECIIKEGAQSLLDVFLILSVLICKAVHCLFFTAVWVFMTLLPTLMLNAERRDVPVGLRDYIGWGVWGLGFVTQAVADQQKWFFKRDPNNAVSALITLI